MASLGLIGALGGLGKGMADVALDSLEEAKLTRLEELRTKNNRETNAMDSEQRHGYAVKEADIQHGYRTDEQAMSNEQDLAKLGVQNEYSLAQLAQQNADQTGRLEKEYGLKNSALTEDQKNMTFVEGKGGPSVAEQYEDGQYRNTNTVRQPDKAVMEERMRASGNYSEEEIKNFVLGIKPSGGADMQKHVLEYTSKYMEDGFTQEDARAKAEALVFGKSAAPSPGGDPSPAPPSADIEKHLKVLRANPKNKQYSDDELRAAITERLAR